MIDVRGRRARAEAVDYAGLVPRAEFDVEAAMDVVRPICDDVAQLGAAAIAAYSLRFDHVVPKSFRVDPDALRAAAEGLEAGLRVAFQTAIDRRRTVSIAERGPELVDVTLGPGAQVSQRLIPVGRVGLYVPGGLAPLASSVIMNVIPAQVAGVGSIALASPPQREFGGLPHPNVLALCHLLGVTEVYAVGGAQAIAMFAYGVPEVCPPVDLVSGPGNIYVVAAKRLLRGKVIIDSEAGPTEIAVLADRTADPVHVAADLVSQAEHDPQAAAVLVTDSPELAKAVQAELANQVPGAKHAERISEALTGRQSALVLVDDLAQGIDVVNAYAAEHLEIQAADAASLAGRVTNAGAIFLGPWSPVSLGDYCAGSTHVLPTGGSAVPLLGAQRPDLPESGARDRLLPLGAGRSSTRGGGVRRRGGSARARRRGRGAVPFSGGSGGVLPGVDTVRDSLAVREAPTLADLPLRPELVGAVPYGAPQLDVPVCLNVNENPYPPSERVVAEIAAAAATAARSLNRYPERDAYALRSDLARYLGHGLVAEQIWAANGSNEVMLHVLQAFAGPGRTVLSFAPTYSMYPEYARDSHSTWRTVPRREDFTIDADEAAAAVRDVRPDVVFVASPNNPTGTAVSTDVLVALCDAAPGVVVVDEAYHEFARTGTPSALELLPHFPRLAVDANDVEGLCVRRGPAGLSGRHSRVR